MNDGTNYLSAEDGEESKIAVVEVCLHVVSELGIKRHGGKGCACKMSKCSS